MEFTKSIFESCFSFTLNVVLTQPRDRTAEQLFYCDTNSFLMATLEHQFFPNSKRHQYLIWKILSQLTIDKDNQIEMHLQLQSSPCYLKSCSVEFP